MQKRKLATETSPKKKIKNTLSEKTLTKKSTRNSTTPKASEKKTTAKKKIVNKLPTKNEIAENASSVKTMIAKTKSKASKALANFHLTPGTKKKIVYLITELENLLDKAEKKVLKKFS